MAFKEFKGLKEHRELRGYFSKLLKYLILLKLPKFINSLKLLKGLSGA